MGGRVGMYVFVRSYVQLRIYVRAYGRVQASVHWPTSVCVGPRVRIRVRVCGYGHALVDVYVLACVRVRGWKPHVTPS